MTRCRCRFGLPRCHSESSPSGARPQRRPTMRLVPIVALFLVASSMTAQPTKTLGSIERLDPALDALVPPNAKIEVLADGFDWTEGPVWRKSGGYLLFSDIPKNTIWKWTEREGPSVFMRPAGYAGPTPSG